MPGQEEIFAALKVWRLFLTDPGTALQQASIAITGPATGGVCTVEGGEFKPRQVQATTVSVPSVNSANFQKHFKKTEAPAEVEEEMSFQPNTRVRQLNVTHGGNGIAYWYPYLDKGMSGGTFGGVGECTIPATAPAGTVALTGAMNGCSLRVYEDRLRGDLHFYHDNNGENLVADRLNDLGYDHLLSINSVNSGTKKRGADNQNIAYWDPHFDAPMRASCYLMSLKTGANEWSIWRSVVLHQFRNEQRGLIFKKTVNNFSYWGDQQYNTLITKLTIAPRRSRSGSVSEVTGSPTKATPPPRGRSGSF